MRARRRAVAARGLTIFLVLSVVAAATLLLMNRERRLRDIAWMRHERSFQCLSDLSDALFRVREECGGVPVPTDTHVELGQDCGSPSELVQTLVHEGYLHDAMICDAFGNPIVALGVEAPPRWQLDPPEPSVWHECTSRFEPHWSDVAVVGSLGTNGRVDGDWLSEFNKFVETKVPKYLAFDEMHKDQIVVGIDIVGSPFDAEATREGWWWHFEWLWNRGDCDLPPPLFGSPAR